jgi:hypothetical protein
MRSQRRALEESGCRSLSTEMVRLTPPSRARSVSAAAGGPAVIIARSTPIANRYMTNSSANEREILMRRKGGAAEEIS